MKRMIALLLVFGMMAMLCACGSSTDEPAQSTAAAAQAETQGDAQTENAAENAVPEDGLVTVVKEILGNAISLADYELSYQDEEMVTLYLLDGEYIELDYTFSLDDGTTITLPMVYGELLDAGWTSSVQWEERAKANTVGFAAHTNANGNTIYITIQNPTDETMNLADIWINQVSMGRDYTEGFNIHGISAGSTIADVVAAWGNPYSIEYYCGENFTNLELNYEAYYGDLIFYIDPETGLVSGATYHVTDNLIG